MAVQANGILALANDKEKLHGCEYSQIEVLLCKVVKSVFGVLPRVDEQIFAIGSHSPATINLFQKEIQSTFGRSVTLADLIQSSTLRSLATFLSQPETDEAWSSIVPLQSSGDLPPFFCVHGAGGEVLSFETLSRLLGPRQPFFGIQPRQISGRPARRTNVRWMASEYIESIQAVQSQGPYYLGGYSFGGTIAFEMAQQLLNAGEEVKILVLIDTEFPGRRYPLPGANNPRLFKRVDYALGKFFILPQEERMGWLEKVLVRNLKRLGLKRTDFSDQLNTLNSDLAAHLSYEPTTLSSRIVLLWASDCAFRASEDSRLAWSEVASLGLEVRRVAGHHLNMLNAPYVNVLARELSSCLAASKR